MAEVLEVVVAVAAEILGAEVALFITHTTTLVGPLRFLGLQFPANVNNLVASGSFINVETAQEGSRTAVNVRVAITVKSLAQALQDMFGKTAEITSLEPLVPGAAQDAMRLSCLTQTQPQTVQSTTKP